MQRTIYLNFSDLTEEAREEIISIAKNNVLESDKEDIIEEYGEDMLETIVSERAERELNNINFIFNA